MTDNSSEIVRKDILVRRDGKALLELAGSGDKWAIRTVAMHYQGGEDYMLPEDSREAARWWQTLVEMNDPDAMFELAHMLLDNRYGIEDRSQARSLLERSASLGNEEASEVLGQEFR